MASRGISPGGALLRASRVFSVPPPLPRPSAELSSTAVFGSNTATLDHPILQTITTPPASRARGDWGFKRPLPLRSTTKTSTPLIRVEAIDTFEHVTEYGSAADHSITLQKWQEMGIPLTQRIKEDTGGYESGAHGRHSVFEAEFDSIAEPDGSVRGEEDTRWKFKGPWLAGQTDGEFNEYLREDVRKRKTEFQTYLRAECATALTKKARTLAIEAAEDIPADLKAEDVTDEQLTEFVRSLRNGRSELYKLIRKFLDLPPAPPIKPVEVTEEIIDILKKTGVSLTDGSTRSKSPYAQHGPPKTHPSAGLAYGLTTCHTYNHPIHGPQKDPPPVQARVVKPRNSATGAFGIALGVGGFVTEVPRGAASFNVGMQSSRRKGSVKLHPGLQNIEPEKVGGSKIWVKPSFACVDPKGRVILEVEDGNSDAIAVAEGREIETPIEYERPKLHTARLQERKRGFSHFKLGKKDLDHGLDVKQNDAPNEGFSSPFAAAKTQVEGLSEL